MARARLAYVRAGQPITAAAFNAIIDELNRINKIGGDGLIDVSNGPDGPKVRRLHTVSGLGLVRARISTDGMTARTGTSPDFICGTGTVTRYTFDGENRTLGDTDEDAFNDYPVTVDGDRDGWFAEIGGSLYIVLENCTSD
jgi:hypothetical protein